MSGKVESTLLGGTQNHSVNKSGVLMARARSLYNISTPSEVENPAQSQLGEGISRPPHSAVSLSFSIPAALCPHSQNSNYTDHILM